MDRKNLMTEQLAVELNVEEVEEVVAPGMTVFD
jgi:hypothetical protein